MVKRVLGILAIVLSFLIIGSDASFAQPDGICDPAATLLVDGTCINTQTNVGSTEDYYGGCVNSNFPSVWYTFTLSSGNNAVDVTFSNITGGETSVSLLLVSGAACTTPTGVATNCDAIPGTLSFYNLTSGTTYYLAITTNPGGNQIDNYTICATEYDGVGTITGPEQDCVGALPACTQTVTQANSYTGIGDVDDIPGAEQPAFIPVKTIRYGTSLQLNLPLP